MPTVTDILKSKASSTVHTIDPGASVFEAVHVMARENIGALVVVERNEVVGIIT